MTSSKLIRWSGIVTILVGVLIFLFGISPSILLPTTEPLLNWVLDNNWVTLNLFAFLLTILLPLSFIGLYAKQIERIGILGFIGFILTFIGSMLYVGVQFDETFTWPVIAVQAPALLDLQGPMFTNPLFSMIFFLMALILIPGIIMFGIATIRAGILPRWGALILIIGLPFACGGFVIQQILRTIGSIFAAIGFSWLGFALWKDKSETH